LASFAIFLGQHGYCQPEGRRRIRLVAKLSQWLVKRRIRLEQFDEHQTAMFLKTRWKTYCHKGGELCTLKLLLRHLRQTGVIPVLQLPLVQSSRDRLVEDYEQFLLQQRGLMARSVKRYLPVLRRFLKYRFAGHQLRLSQLRAEDADNFIVQTSARYGRRTLQTVTTVLRGFFGFLLQHGRITTPLANAVPMVTARGLVELPKSLAATQIRKLLKSCNRRQRIGRRDYAILLLLARLGLRAGEVAGLDLEDIDWRSGEVVVRGKGRRMDRLPLLRDVGRAIADYLKTRRSVGSSRKVFLLTTAPYQGFAGSSSVSGLVRRSLVRAQLDPPHKGAHLLRHGLATRMLQGGATLTQIGQILRHQLAQTTQIYAKVDLHALRKLAQPWPGGVR
jgi:site-specific recombinase XerD